MTSRAALAAPLLLQTPPGQLSNVYDDLHGLIRSEDEGGHDDEEFQKLAIHAREQHNLEQHIIVDLPEGNGKGIICPSAVHLSGSGRFMSPRHQISYLLDHKTLSTSEAKQYKPNPLVESYRSLLDKYISTYLADKFATGVVEVFAIPLPRKVMPIEEKVQEEAKEIANTLDPSLEAGAVSSSLIETPEVGQTSDIAEGANEGSGAETAEIEDSAMAEVEDDPLQTAQAMEEVGEQGTEARAPSQEPVDEADEESEGDTKIVIHIVADRYKLSNYWSGRWRSTYVLESAMAAKLEGTIKVQVHYFEEGNVQLNSSKSDTLTISTEDNEDTRARAVVRAIEESEGRYQEEVFKTCNELSEGAFKSLRRQLPMTKQKVDWDKVLNYKLGSELAE